MECVHLGKGERENLVQVTFLDFVTQQKYFISSFDASTVLVHTTNSQFCGVGSSWKQTGRFSDPELLWLCHCWIGGAGTSGICDTLKSTQSNFLHTGNSGSDIP